MEINKKTLRERINELDDNYQTLKDDLGYTHPDVQYLKGHRDALLTIYIEFN